MDGGGLVRCGRALVGVDADGIFVVRCDEDIEVGVEDVARWIAFQLESAPGCVPVLIDARDIRSMTRAAQHETTVPALRDRTACVAILTESPVSVMVANFFMIFARPPYPAKLFTSEIAARAWCRSVVNQP